MLKSLATPLDGARRRGSLPSTPKYTRYLKISEGCGNRCAYCAIPSIRGPLRSLPVDVIVKEAQQLVGEGARELCVVGQDLTVYGTDNGSGKGLTELLDALESSLPYDIWIRLLYLHPTRVTNKLLERVAAGRQIIPYLDIPVGALRSIFRTAREINPDFTLRTTCMVGFPGEKKKHFDNLVSFVKEVRFDRMGAFTFYAEEGTPAECMAGQVSEATKKKRLDALMRVQEEISFERQQAFVGRERRGLRRGTLLPRSARGRRPHRDTQYKEGYKRRRHDKRQDNGGHDARHGRGGSPMILTPEMKTWYGLVATVGTIGRFSRMPGTLGSVAGTVLWILLGGAPLWLIAAVAVLGVAAADKYEKAAERDDPGEVVIDEVVGVWIASWGFDMTYAIPALFLFRIVDIVKPFPVSWFDKIPGGKGIMADDIVGGIMVNLMLRFVHWLLFAEGLTAILEMVGR